MIEVPTTVGAGLAILASKGILDKLLGPSAEYLGKKTVGLIEKCDINLDNIFVKTRKKLGSEIEKPGTVNLRVLKGVLDEGRFCDDDFVAEYYSGILASSRSHDGKDDRGVMYLSILRALSSYQLKLHYLIYHNLALLFHGKSINLGLAEDQKKMQLYISTIAFMKALNLTPDNTKDPFVLRYHAIIGLHSHGLIGDGYVYGKQEHMQKYFPDATEYGGILVTPTLLGAELYLWGQGKRDQSAHRLTEVEPDTPLIPMSNEICATKGVM